MFIRECQELYFNVTGISYILFSYLIPTRLQYLTTLNLTRIVEVQVALFRHLTTSKLEPKRTYINENLAYNDIAVFGIISK